MPNRSGRSIRNLPHDTVAGRRPRAGARAADERRQLSLADPGAAAAGAVELIDLDEDEQAQFMGEIAARGARAQRRSPTATSSTSPRSATRCAQLHVHVIARRHSDTAWPRAGLGRGAGRRLCGGGALRALDAALREAIVLTSQRAPLRAHGAGYCERASPRRAICRRMPSRPDLGPKPHLGYTESRIERAAELRTNGAAVATAGRRSAPPASM